MLQVDHAIVAHLELCLGPQHSSRMKIVNRSASKRLRDGVCKACSVGAPVAGCRDGLCQSVRLLL